MRISDYVPMLLGFIYVGLGIVLFIFGLFFSAQEIGTALIGIVGFAVAYVTGPLLIGLGAWIIYDYWRFFN